LAVSGLDAVASRLLLVDEADASEEVVGRCGALVLLLRVETHRLLGGEVRRWGALVELG